MRGVRVGGGGWGCEEIEGRGEGCMKGVSVGLHMRKRGRK